MVYSFTVINEISKFFSELRSIIFNNYNNPLLWITLFFSGVLLLTIISKTLK